jgi:tRNA pseudouridine(38-40) synthase
VLNQNARFIPSGRTDARVSARAQMVQFDANLTGLFDHVRGLARGANGSAADPVDPAGPAAAAAAAAAANAAGNAEAHSEDDAAAVLVRLVPLLVHHFNAALPNTIRVLSLSRAAKNFNAMRPTWKRYVYTFTPSREEGISLSTWCERVLCPREYRKKLQLLAQATSAGAERGGSIDQGSAAADASDNGASFAMSLPPQISAMNAAAAGLVGTHDFAGFQSKGGRKTTTRTVHACNVVETTTTTTTMAGNGEIGGTTLQLTITGSGFLMHMVRIIAGTLLEVGCGMRTVQGATRALATLSRQDAGPTLPSARLCLDCVHYDQLEEEQPYL